jgi:hypothetical protein
LRVHHEFLHCWFDLVGLVDLVKMKAPRDGSMVLLLPPNGVPQ